MWATLAAPPVTPGCPRYVHVTTAAAGHVYLIHIDDTAADF